jgi:DNA adenine methylase
MRTPITYYGGKQNLAAIIVPLLPPHRLYCEPFAGGLAILYAKLPSTEEVVNDLNPEMINFWNVLKYDFDALYGEVVVSLHSRKLHKQAGVVYFNPDMFNHIKRAWAAWYLATASFGSMLDGAWGHDVRGKRISALRGKVADFTPEVSRRLTNVQIENYDAVKVIRDNDAPDALFYADPPYVGADQGHYAGYTQADFNALLDTLSDIKGKFLLSSYPNNRLMALVRKLGWSQLEIKMNNPMSKKEKTEVLTANYPIYDKRLPAALFD